MQHTYDEECVDRPTCAAILKISPITLEKWARRRFGPRVTKVGRLVRYRRSEIARWLQSVEQHRGAAAN